MNRPMHAGERRLASGRGLLVLCGCALACACVTRRRHPAPLVVTAPIVAKSTPGVAPTPGLDPRARLRKVLELLDVGQRDQARADAQELVRQQPDDARAKSLLNQIDADPKVLLGAQNFAYKIRPGETLSLLAERFLGDKYLFYALARYNGIDAPGQAEVGRTIMVPGTPREAPPPVAPPPHRRTPEPPVIRRPPPAAAPAPTPAPPPVKEGPSARDVAHASALRRDALVQMNKGQIDSAVGLLRQAARLDPGNAAISGDLARATRLQAAARR